MAARAPLYSGLLGRSIAASSSPAIHQREAQALGLDLTYSLYDFDQMDLDDCHLGSVVERLAQEGLSGVNITHPFKQQIMPLLDDIEPTACALGAVNCVAFDGGRKYGFNSDWSGFSFLLANDLAGAKLGRVAQIGAGGAGSATAYALLASGAEQLVLCDNSADRTDALEKRLSTAFPDRLVEVETDPAKAIAGADGVVQATPVGMDAHPGMPFDPALLQSKQWLADVIYFPLETALVKAAKARGVRAVGGSAMVVGQAIEAFRRFTGAEPDRDRMMADFAAATNRSTASSAEVQ